MKTIILLLALLVLSGCDEDAIKSFNQSNQASVKTNAQTIEPTTDMAAGYGFPVIVFDEDIVLGGVHFYPQSARLIAIKTLGGTQVELFVPKLTHPSTSIPASADFNGTPIPINLRPVNQVSSVYSITKDRLRRIHVSGTNVYFQYLDWSGNNMQDTHTGVACSISWYIPD